MAALEDEAPGDEDEGLAEERAALEDEAPGEAAEEGEGLAEEEGDGLSEEREALEEAAGAFLVEPAGCLERLLEEKRPSMLAGVGVVGAEARDRMAVSQV